MYEQYCWNNGWLAKANHREAYKQRKDYDLQPNDDENGDMALWSTESICIPKCTYIYSRIHGMTISH